MAWYYNAVSNGVVSMQYQAISSTCMFHVHIQIVEDVWNLCIVYVFLCVCSCQYPCSTNIPYFISLYADEKIITITHPALEYTLGCRYNICHCRGSTSIAMDIKQKQMSTYKINNCSHIVENLICMTSLLTLDHPKLSLMFNQMSKVLR